MALSLIKLYKGTTRVKSNAQDFSEWNKMSSQARSSCVSEFQEYFVANGGARDFGDMMKDEHVLPCFENTADLITRRYGVRQQTTLHRALEDREFGLATIILEKAPNELLGIRDIDGNTPLKIALKNGATSDILLAIARRMTTKQVLMADNEGWNSLLSAVHFNQIDVALIMVKKTPYDALVTQLQNTEFDLINKLRSANMLDVIEAIEKKVERPLSAFVKTSKQKAPVVVQEKQAIALSAPEIPSIENARVDIATALESGRVEDAQQAGEGLLRAVSKVAEYGARVSLAHFEKTAMVKEILDELSRIAKTSQTMIIDAKDNPQSLLPDHSLQGKLRQMLYSFFPSMDRIKRLNDTMEQMLGTPDSVIDEAFQIIRMHREIDERYLPMDQQLAEIEELFLNAAREIDARLEQAQQDNNKQLEARYPDLQRYFVDCATNVRANRAIVHQMGQASGIIISTEIALVGSMRQTRTAMAAIATSTMAVVAQAQQAMAANTQVSSMDVLRTQFLTTNAALDDIVARLGTDSANLENSQRRLLSAAHVSAANDAGIPLCIEKPLEVLIPVDSEQPQAAAPAANI